MVLIKFYAWVIRIGLLVALCGQLKACTLELMGKAALKHEMMSYSKFSRALTSPQ